MSGANAKPLLSPATASRLLDEVVYERVLACIDACAVCELERELCRALDACGLDDAAIIDMADAMIGRALRRIADAPRREQDVRVARGGVGDDDCVLCQELAHPPQRGRG